MDFTLEYAVRVITDAALAHGRRLGIADDPGYITRVVRIAEDVRDFMDAGRGDALDAVRHIARTLGITG